jgi:hypothetical protein
VGSPEVTPKHHQKKKKKKKRKKSWDQRDGSNSRMPALQVQSPEFPSSNSSPIKTNKQTKTILEHCGLKILNADSRALKLSKC